jgi:ring-1,2-phenylacetyl-CoA epoxidase subunit PaaE
LFATSTKENAIEKSLWAFKITIMVDDEETTFEMSQNRLFLMPL